MTDELDLLRSVRPEAAGPTDDLVQKERTQFMDLIANDQLSAHPSRRRRRLIAIAVAAALMAAGGATAGSLLIPGDVHDSLDVDVSIADAPGGKPLASFSTDPAKAQLRASTRLAAGGSLELWTAPTKQGGSCQVVRHLDAADQPTDPGPLSCRTQTAEGAGEVAFGSTAGPGSGNRVQSMLSAEGKGGFAAHAETEAGGRTALYGTAPAGATTLVAKDAAGKEARIAVGAGGWYIASLAAAPETVAALDAAGATLATLQVAPPAGADGPIPATRAQAGAAGEAGMSGSYEVTVDGDGGASVSGSTKR